MRPRQYDYHQSRDRGTWILAAICAVIAVAAALIVRFV